MQDVDLIHVCYGGLGGHVSVVNTLTSELATVGISSGVVAVGAESALVRSMDSWPNLAFAEFVPVTRRADLASMWTAMKVARKVRSRVVVMHTLRHTTPIALGRITTGQRLRIVTRESHGLPSRNWIVDVQSASSIMWGQAVIFLTRENMAGYPLRRLPLRGLRRQVVIPNGVDTARFVRRSRAARALGAPVVLGMAARFVPGKDFDTLVRGLAILHAEHGPDCPQLLLAGDGPSRAGTHALVERLGLRDHVRFLGHLPETQMPDFMDGLDIYVQLTDGEAFSMSLIQACASGLPVITSDVPGVRDVFVDGDTALLVEPRRPEAVADALRALLAPASDLAADVAARAHRMVVDRYSSAHMARAYLQLFAQLDGDGPWSAALAALVGRDPGDEPVAHS